MSNYFHLIVAGGLLDRPAYYILIYNLWSVLASIAAVILVGSLDCSDLARCGLAVAGTQRALVAALGGRQDNSEKRD